MTLRDGPFAVCWGAPRVTNPVPQCPGVLSIRQFLSLVLEYGEALPCPFSCPHQCVASPLSLRMDKFLLKIKPSEHDAVSSIASSQGHQQCPHTPRGSVRAVRLFGCQSTHCLIELLDKANVVLHLSSLWGLA
jgi:hypothetical protein